MVDVDQGEHRVAGRHQFADVGHALAHLAGQRRVAAGFLARGVDFGLGAFGLPHLRQRRALPGPGDQRLHGLWRALDQGLHPSVGKIAYPAAQVQAPRLFDGAGAVAHALHAAFDQQVAGDNDLVHEAAMIRRHHLRRPTVNRPHWFTINMDLIAITAYRTDVTIWKD